MPAYVASWDAKALKARIVFGALEQQELVAPQDVQERRYALRTVKQRLHQASFLEAVISAYRGRCSLSGLPEKRLLGACLIGIDPDYRVHVSDRLPDQQDAMMLEALKLLDGGEIHLPRRSADFPDRDRLAQRYDLFRKAA